MDLAIIQLVTALKTIRQINTGGSGSGWGYVSKENAESIKMGTDESIDGLSDALFDGIQHTKEVDGKWIINNRTNYYHKPVYNLNHFWKIDDKNVSEFYMFMVLMVEGAELVL